MRAPLWLVFAFALLAFSADPVEVSIRSGSYSPHPPVISAQSNLVESAVTVYDTHGALAGGLTAADFVVLDEGKLQPITFFSELRNGEGGKLAAGETVASAGVVTHQARSIALYFDDLHFAGAGLQPAIEAARKLIGGGLKPGERIGLFTDSGTVTVDFTSNTTALLAALSKIKPHNDPADRVMTNCPSLTPYTAYLIAEHIEYPIRERAVQEVMSPRCDGVSHDVAEGKVQDYAESLWENSRHRSTSALDVLKLVVGHLAKQDGSRILILLSEGFIDDERMKSQKNAIFDDALRAHVVINSLAALGLLQDGLSYRQMILTNAMADAAAATGGRLIKNDNDLAGSLGELAAAPAVSYLLGFQAGVPDGKYHALKIRVVNRAGFRVQARAGYIAAVAVSEKPSVQQRIDSAVLSHTLLQEMPAVVRVIPEGRKDDRYTFQVVVDIDAKRIRFAPQGGVNLQQLTFVTVIQDGQGAFVTGKEAVMDLRVKPATLNRMQQTGIHAVESFSLPSGAYTVREVVRELVQDHMAASNTPVELR